MIKIGEFSKLAHLTVKALRFYEKQGILMPAVTDPLTGYRFYETGQLLNAAKIKSFRQLGLTIDEIKVICSGADEREILSAKLAGLCRERDRMDALISSIYHILEDKEMKYHVTEKIIPETLVYTAETVLNSYKDIMQWIPSVGRECLALNPGIKCAEPPYGFCEYLDGEYRETGIRIRHNEAVTATGKENEHIHFCTLPRTKVLSIFHRGPYEDIGQAYAYIMNYARENGYQIAGPARECYIDGIWNKEDPSDWLTEIQLPVTQ